MRPEEAATLLASSPLFAIFDGSARLKIAEQANERAFPKGALIFSEGDPGDAFYVIVDGRVKVVVTSARGDEVVLATVGPPEVLGSVAMLDGGARSASAEALDQVTMLAFARSTFVELVRREPSIAVPMLQNAGGLLRRLTGQVADLVFLDLEGRIAKLLLHMAEEQGERQDGVATLDLGLTQTDLARMVGGSRQSVNQILHTLQARGFIELSGRSVRIADEPGLRRRAGLP